MASPDVKKIRNLAGEGYFKLDGTNVFLSLGHTESISINTEVTKDEIFSSITGVRSLADTEVTERKVTGGAVLRETGARQIAMASLANKGLINQDAQTSLTLSGSASAGDTIDLGALNVTITSLTDGTDPLVEGQDYKLDAAAGILTFLVDITTYTGAYDTAAITDADDKALIAALSASEGISGELMVIQRQTRGGNRFKYNAKVRIYPDGDFTLSKEGTDAATIQVKFDVVQDTSKPAGAQFGVFREIKG
ncbi:hypothetical protein BMI91_19610 [Thioclava sediminum]|uniref:Major tail protein n=1 Tax=Thioclava sediminum TaxID=1915319 RepID=A0ABX3MSB5_9RHOB|nr:hypothetical protein [Thioclava sediminum]OOY22491.1 hypothetical protein BMI91_19610 [Thioclava sediminum]